MRNGKGKSISFFSFFFVGVLVRYLSVLQFQFLLTSVLVWSCFLLVAVCNIIVCLESFGKDDDVYILHMYIHNNTYIHTFVLQYIMYLSIHTIYTYSGKMNAICDAHNKSIVSYLIYRLRFYKSVYLSGRLAGLVLLVDVLRCFCLWMSMNVHNNILVCSW